MHQSYGSMNTTERNPNPLQSENLGAPEDPWLSTSQRNKGTSEGVNQGKGTSSNIVLASTLLHLSLRNPFLIALLNAVIAFDRFIHLQRLIYHHFFTHEEGGTCPTQQTCFTVPVSAPT